jgi:hypothetical protein
MTLSYIARNGAPLAALAVALALASCAATEEVDVPLASGPLAPAIVAEAEEAPLALRPGDPATPLEIVTPKYVPVPAVIVAEAKATAVNGRIATAQAGPNRAAIQDDPDRLLGLEHSRVSELFGRPSFVRQDAPAALWRYRSNGCIVDLYLYPAFNEQAQAVGELRVRHVEVRAASGGKTDVQACLGALIAQQPPEGRG